MVKLNYNGLTLSYYIKFLLRLQFSNCKRFDWPKESREKKNSLVFEEHEKKKIVTLEYDVIHFRKSRYKEK